MNVTREISLLVFDDKKLYLLFSAMSTGMSSGLDDLLGFSGGGNTMSATSAPGE